jgi:hypothetical protein
MVQFVGCALLERRNFEARVETWLDGDARGAWHHSPDVSRAFDKQKRDVVYGLRASAVSAFTAWLRARGQAYEASVVQWRFDHQAPVPPLPPSPTGTVQVLPGQMSLFG